MSFLGSRLLESVNKGPIQFYLCLPQTTMQVVNGNVVDRALTTCHGNANIGSMTPKEIRSKVVDLGSFDVPCDLVWNPGILTNTVMDNMLLWCWNQ